MKKNLITSVKLTIVMITILGGLYPLLIAGVAKFAPGNGKGETLSVNGKVVGYANIGQKFTDDKYFWSRPSAVDYNAAGSGGSNKGPSNPDYLKLVQDRIDTFMVHNPGIKKEEIPSDMVTASGSGLDPDISVQGAQVQVKRIASVRYLNKKKVYTIIDQKPEHHHAGILGPSIINVLKLNIA